MFSVYLFGYTLEEFHGTNWDSQESPFELPKVVDLGKFVWSRSWHGEVPNNPCINVLKDNQKDNFRIFRIFSESSPTCSSLSLSFDLVKWIPSRKKKTGLTTEIHHWPRILGRHRPYTLPRHGRNDHEELHTWISGFTGSEPVTPWEGGSHIPQEFGGFFNQFPSYLFSWNMYVDMLVFWRVIL